MLNDPINKGWRDNYCRDFNNGSLDKEGLSNILTFEITSYVTDIKNYLIYGLRDHFVRLVKNLFPKEKANTKKIAALRFLKKMQGDNKRKEFSFILSSKDIFVAKLKRDNNTEEKIQRILNDELLKDHHPIDKTYSSVFKFIHWIYEKGKDFIEKSFL